MFEGQGSDNCAFARGNDKHQNSKRSSFFAMNLECLKCVKRWLAVPRRWAVCLTIKTCELIVRLLGVMDYDAFFKKCFLERSSGQCGAMKIVLTCNDVQRNEEFYFDSSFLRILTVGKRFVLARIYKAKRRQACKFFPILICNINCIKT